MDLDKELTLLQLANRCLIGSASEAEREQLATQLNEPEARAAYEKMRRAWEKSPEILHNERRVNAVARRVALGVKVMAEKAQEEPEEATPTHRLRWLSGPALALAASFVIAAVSAGLWFKQISVDTAKAQRTLSQATCGVSERREVVMDDGTKITLNSESTLLYPQKFGPRGRLVRLTGEAFFDVTHDESRPFVVETPTLRIKVLGTEFNVRAFSDGSEAKVTLVKGKVEVSEVAPQGESAKTEPVHLTPGQQFELSPDGGKAEVKPIATDAATGWMEDHLIWRDEPAATAMRQLERRYGIVVKFTDPKLGELTLNGRFEGASLEEIFDSLRRTEILDYRMERTNGKIERVTLSPGRLATETKIDSQPEVMVAHDPAQRTE